MHRLAIASCVLLFGCGGASSSWPSATPRTVQFRASAQTVYDLAVTTLRMSGYSLTDYDDARMYVQVLSRVDGDVYAQSHPGFGGPTAELVERVSAIGMQFFANGTLVITVSGYHVEDGRLDPRVAREVDTIVDTIWQNAGLPPVTSGAPVR